VQSGLCELVKNVLAITPHHYNEVVELLRPSGVYSDSTYLRFLWLSLEAKRSVMSSDPHERGRAMVLEYGHTVGHALEVESSGEVPHGFAVGLGMLVAARVSRELGLLSRDGEAAHWDLLERNGAPTSIPGKYATDAVLERVAFDNKRGHVNTSGGFQPMVLLRELGMPEYEGETPLTCVAFRLLRQAIDSTR
jgi:3-dehydroquinate synthase/2-deoxy-scyllo-inosose synthase